MSRNAVSRKLECTASCSMGYPLYRRTVKTISAQSVTDLITRTSGIAIDISDLARDDSRVHEPSICDTQPALSLILLAFSGTTWGFDSFERSRCDTVILDTLKTRRINHWDRTCSNLVGLRDVVSFSCAVISHRKALISV